MIPDTVSLPEKIAVGVDLKEEGKIVNGEGGTAQDRARPAGPCRIHVRGVVGNDFARGDLIPVRLPEGTGRGPSHRIMGVV